MSEVTRQKNDDLRIGVFRWRPLKFRGRFRDIKHALYIQIAGRKAFSRG